MLYDPKWAKPSLAGLVTWLKQQNPRKRFEYMPPDNCAIGQYLKSTGTSYSDYCLTGREEFSNLRAWNRHITRHATTFGGALKKAKAYLAKHG